MSLTKAKIREIRDLGRKKDREAAGHFIVDGVRGVREAMQSRFPVVEVYYTGELLGAKEGEDLVREATHRTRSTLQITTREMEQVSDTVNAQGVLAVMQKVQWSSRDVLRRDHGSSVVVALDAVADPGNLGSIIRTCDWFGVDALLLGTNSVELYNPKVVRSTVGSIFHLPILVDVDLQSVLPEAKESGYTVYSTAAGGSEELDAVRFAEKTLFVLGNEAWGVSEQVARLADTRLAIRRHGKAESLNVGVACGIVLAGIRRGVRPHVS
jgi:RNA methyltransferase, TrmH family